MKKSYFVFVLPVWLFLGMSFPSIADYGTVAPNAEVVLVYEEGENIVIMECRKYATLPNHEDEGVDFWKWRRECRHGLEMERGRFKSRIPEAVFKKSLLLALRVPGDYEPALQEKITVYNRKEEEGQRVQSLLEERKRLTARLGHLEGVIVNFAIIYNEELIDISDLEEIAALSFRLEEIELELSLGGGMDRLEAISQDIEGMVDDLIADIKDNKRLEFSVYPDAGENWPLNLLRTLVKTPVLPSFVKMWKGPFLMGSPDGEANRDEDENQKEVRFTRDFEIGATEVTQLQYFLVKDENPSFFKREGDCDNRIQIDGVWMCPNNPAENMTWDDLHISGGFLEKISAFFGMPDCDLNPRKSVKGCLRLPTEAEWEYAARGGGMFMESYPFHADNLQNYGVYAANSEERTHEVRSKLPTVHGLLYGMQGNVWEFVYDQYFAELPEGDDPVAVQTSSESLYHVIRGGSWGSSAEDLRSANRRSEGTAPETNSFGLRLVKTL